MALQQIGWRRLCQFVPVIVVIMMAIAQRSRQGAAGHTTFLPPARQAARPARVGAIHPH
jgi:hypothetical protein